MDKQSFRIDAAERVQRMQTRRREIGDVIRTHRRAHGVTMEALAQLLGVRRQTISQIERGLASLDLPSLELVAEVLAIHPDELWPASDHRGKLRKVELPARPGEVLQITIEVTDGQ